MNPDPTMPSGVRRPRVPTSGPAREPRQRSSPPSLSEDPTTSRTSRTPRKEERESSLSKDVINSLKMISSDMEGYLKDKKYLEELRKEEEKKKQEEERRQKEEINVLIGLSNNLEKISKETGISRKELIKKSVPDANVQRQLEKIQQEKENLSDRESKTHHIADSLEGIKNAVFSVAKRNEDSIKNAVLGPFQLLTSPIEEFFGGDLFEGFMHPKTKVMTKRNPNRADVAKTGDMGALYLADQLASRVKTKEGEGGPLDSLLKGLGNVGEVIGDFLKGPMGKKLGLGAVVGGLLMAVSDGFSGMTHAKDWGVNDFSAFIGGFLGGTSKGWEGSIPNMAKGGLIGGGVGLTFGGPLGLIIGGLLGVAVGGILGYLGGEEIAKKAQDISQGIGDLFSGKTLNEGKASSGMLWQNVAATGQDPYQQLKGNKQTEKSKTQQEFYGMDKSKESLFFIDMMQDKTNVGAQIFNKELETHFGSNYGTANIPDLLKSNKLTKEDQKKLNQMATSLLMQSKDRGIYDLADRGLVTSTEDYNSVYGGIAPSTLALNKLKKSFPDRKKIPEEQLKPFALGWGNLKTKDEVYKEIQDKYQVKSVNDAIIKPDGTIIRTHPDDTIVATKNRPEVMPQEPITIPKNTQKESSDPSIPILQKIADLLSELVKKPIGSNQVVSQTSYDLEMLALGGF